MTSQLLTEIEEINTQYIEQRIREFVKPEHEVASRNRKYRFDVYVYMPDYEAAYYKNLRCKTIEQAIDTAEYFYHRSQKTNMIDLIEILESKIKY